MKSIKALSQLLIIALSFVFHIKVNAQIESANLVIDSINVVFKGNLSFPFWLREGQTLNIGPNTSSISILEFIIDTANGNNLKFSQVLTIKSNAKVPASRTWKIEAVAFMDNAIVGTKPSLLNSPARFSTPGTYTWVVPADVSRICVEVWGGGGNGANGDWNTGGGGGGGGGGYGYGCYTFQPNSSHTVIVGGSGGRSSIDGTLLYANAGSNGTVTAGGSGGISNGTILNITGAVGNAGNGLPYPGWIGQMGGGAGGKGANGGSGGVGGQATGSAAAGSGSAFGGGGGGGGAENSYRTNYNGAGGGSGAVIISW